MELVTMQTIDSDPRQIVQPLIYTERLILRPLKRIDARVIQFLAGEKIISANTLSIPHPYPEGLAEKWIGSLEQEFSQGKNIVFGIAENNNGNLMGSIGLKIDKDAKRAELGYWIGKDYWGQGYCSEAARNLVEYGFSELGLSEIYACHFDGNNASGKVLTNIGMTYEGIKKDYVKKGARSIDVHFYRLRCPAKALKDEL